MGSLPRPSMWSAMRRMGMLWDFCFSIALTCVMIAAVGLAVYLVRRDILALEVREQECVVQCASARAKRIDARCHCETPTGWNRP